MGCSFKQLFQQTKKTFSKINPNIYYMGLVGFFMNFAATMIYTTLLIFVGGKGNVFSNNSIIAIRNFAESLANFSKIFSGYISDKLQDRKTFLLIGYGAMLITKLGFMLLTFKDFFPLFFLQILYVVNQIVDRCMNAIRDPARDAILMEYSNENTRGIAFGIRKFVTSFGSIFSGIMVGSILLLWQSGMSELKIYQNILVPILAILIFIVSYLVKKTILTVLFGLIFIFLTPFVSGELIQLSSFTFAFPKLHLSSLLYLISILPVVLTIILLKIRVEDNKKLPPNTEVINLRLIKENFYKLKGIFILLALMCFLTLGKLNDFCAFSLGIQIGMSKYRVPFIFAATYVFITLMSTVFGYFIDKKKHFFVILSIIVCLLISNYLFYIATNYYIYWLGIFFFSCFLAASDSAIASLITFLIPSPNMKATVYGIFYGVSGLVSIVNALLVSFLENQYGLRQVYLISLIPIFISLMIFLIFYKDILSQKHKF